MPYAPLSTNAGAASGGGYVPLSSGGGSPAPRGPAAPTVSAPTLPSPASGGGGYVPLVQGGAAKVSTPSSPAPASTPAFSGKGYGAASETDLSGRPYAMVPMTIPKTFMSPETTVSVEDKTRTAPEFDPTKPQNVTAAQTTNPRMAQSISSAIRKALGATAFQELDHIMPLELGGSNDKSNLRLETAQDPSKPYNPSSNPTPTDPLENELGFKVKNGATTGVSLLDAWRQ